MFSDLNKSGPTVQRAVKQTALALLSLAFPFLCILVFGFPYIPNGGLFLILFPSLYLFFAIRATIASYLAGRRHEWVHPDGGKRLMLTLYGTPFAIALLLLLYAFIQIRLLAFGNPCIPQILRLVALD